MNGCEYIYREISLNFNLHQNQHLMKCCFIPFHYSNLVIHDFNIRHPLKLIYFHYLCFNHLIFFHFNLNHPHLKFIYYFHSNFHLQSFYLDFDFQFLYSYSINKSFHMGELILTMKKAVCSPQRVSELLFNSEKVVEVVK